MEGPLLGVEIRTWSSETGPTSPEGGENGRVHASCWPPGLTSQARGGGLFLVDLGQSEGPSPDCHLHPWACALVAPCV